MDGHRANAERRTQQHLAARRVSSLHSIHFYPPPRQPTHPPLPITPTRPSSRRSSRSSPTSPNGLAPGARRLAALDIDHLHAGGRLGCDRAAVVTAGADGRVYPPRNWQRRARLDRPQRGQARRRQLGLQIRRRPAAPEPPAPAGARGHRRQGLGYDEDRLRARARPAILGRPAGLGGGAARAGGAPRRRPADAAGGQARRSVLLQAWRRRR